METSSRYSGASAGCARLPVFPGAVGIDLGTTNSCVAVWRGSAAEVLADEVGDRVVPSVVAFTPSGGILVGKAAQDHAWTDSANTVHDTKRLLGMKVSEPVVQEDMRIWPFRVVGDEEDQPLICVRHGGAEHRHRAEYVSSLILRRLRQIAEARLGASVTRAVITVPAYFGESQRQATRAAGRLAGLEVLRIINEPTAAALACGIGQDYSAEKCVLVFDLGGGTFDVSLLRVFEGRFEVLAVAGDTHLGGGDIDSRLARLVSDVMRSRLPADVYESVSDDPQLLHRIRSACEAAKRELSESTSAEIAVRLPRGGQCSLTVTRQEMEDCCCDLFAAILGPIQSILSDAGVPPDRVDDVVMVGGASRMPRVIQIVSDVFGRKVRLRPGVSADEAIAEGAAIQASILAPTAAERSQLEQSVTLLDVTPLSLGIHSRGDFMSTIVPRNTQTPCRFQKYYTTDYDNQETVHIRVYEGERPFTHQNTLIGSFRLHGIAPAPRRTPKILVTFEIDRDGLLAVSAEDQRSKRSEQLVVKTDTATMSEGAIQSMLATADLHIIQDVRDLARCKAAWRLRTELEEFGGVQSTADDPAAVQAIAHGFAWLREQGHSAGLDELLEQQRLLAEGCKGIAKAKRQKYLMRLLA